MNDNQSEKQVAICDDCGGNGWRDGDGYDLIECSNCKGHGIIEEVININQTQSSKPTKQ